MPVVSTCPRCRAAVTIPDSVAPQNQVRCPLCTAVFPLADAWAELPPALEPVETAPVDGGNPQQEYPFAPSEAAAAAAGQLEPTLAQGPAEAESPDASEQPALDARNEQPALDARDVLPKIDTGRPPPEAEPTVSVQVGEADAKPALDSLAASARRNGKKTKGPIRFFLEVVGGGLLGLLIGYYALCWLGGNRLDLPKLPLPWLPHTVSSEPPLPEAAGPDSPSPPGN